MPSIQGTHQDRPRPFRFSLFEDRSKTAKTFAEGVTSMTYPDKQKAIATRAELVVDVRPNQSSPTFVAEFADGVVTRMTCHCVLGKLDPQRGIKLSNAAYTSRTGKSPPVIVAARFVEPFTDNVIKTYDSVELERKP